MTRIDFKVLTANNRLVAAADTTGDENSGDQMRYDQAGNLIYDNYSPPAGQRGGMVYDAENRMTSAVNGYHQYRYDAGGKRTRKLVTGSPELWLVYGANGELVAEYDAVMPGGTLKKEYGYRGGQMLVVYDAGQSGDNRLKWLVTDHLGSTRMPVNRSGGLCGAIERLDYLPFGEELASTIGHRNASCSGYGGGGSLRQKFTSKERDTETGLDFFSARYFSSMQGRFTSVDPGSFNIADPQSWNRYSFVLNDPLKFIDPTGRELYLTGDESDAFLEYLKQKSGYNLSLDKNGKVKIEKGKRNEQGTSKELADVLKKVVGASEKASFIVTKDDPPENFVDNTTDAAKTGAIPKVDFNDIRELDRQSPEFGIALVGHFLQERLAIVQGIDAIDTQILGRGLVKGAHTLGLEVESKILSRFTRQNEQLRREIDRNPTFSFVYSSIQYDVTIKSTGTNNATSVDKVDKKKP